MRFMPSQLQQQGPVSGLMLLASLGISEREQPVCQQGQRALAFWEKAQPAFGGSSWNCIWRISDLGAGPGQSSSQTVEALCMRQCLQTGRNDGRVGPKHPGPTPTLGSTAPTGEFSCDCSPQLGWTMCNKTTARSLPLY